MIFNIYKVRAIIQRVVLSSASSSILGVPLVSQYSPQHAVMPRIQEAEYVVECIYAMHWCVCAGMFLPVCRIGGDYD